MSFTLATVTADLGIARLLETPPRHVVSSGVLLARGAPQT
jgi:hypothetical protein